MAKRAESVVLEAPAEECAVEPSEAQVLKADGVETEGGRAPETPRARAAAARGGRRARLDARWAALEEAARRREVVRVRVLGMEGSDLVAHLPGRVKGVIPASEVGELPGGERSVTNLLGLEVPVYVERIDREAGVAVLSRRKAREDLARRTGEALRVGERLRARVHAAYPKGLVVDLDGVYAYVPGGEIAWHRVELPAEEFPVGSEIEVEVVDIQDPPAEGRHAVTASRRRCLPDPWVGASRRIALDSLRVGVVTASYESARGARMAFVALEPELTIKAVVRGEVEALLPGDQVLLRVREIDELEHRGFGVIVSLVRRGGLDAVLLGRG